MQNQNKSLKKSCQAKKPLSKEIMRKIKTQRIFESRRRKLSLAELLDQSSGRTS